MRAGRVGTVIKPLIASKSRINALGAISRGVCNLAIIVHVKLPRARIQSNEVDEAM